MIATPEGEEIRRMISVYEQRGIEQGKQESLLKLIRHKFGKLPGEVTRRIEAITDPNELDRLMVQVVDSPTLEDLDLTEA